MKPLIPTYVIGGIERLKTDQMSAVIKKCYYEEGLIGVAKLDETYNRAKATLPNDITDIALPEGNEPEEDVGQVTEDQEDDAVNNLTFEVE
eukprot:gene15475-20881_t